VSWSVASGRSSSTPSSSSSPGGCTTSSPWDRCGRGSTRATAEELLERLGLSAFAEANPFTLSGGQQRRLSVATALATSPQVLVLDEPTFGQDAATWRELVTLLAEQRARGCAVVTVTHDRDLVEVLADERLDL
jgi:energy-coupling factor transporter ATP-binding protein EcfA2